MDVVGVGCTGHTGGRWKQGWGQQSQATRVEGRAVGSMQAEQLRVVDMCVVGDLGDQVPECVSRGGNWQVPVVL